MNNIVNTIKYYDKLLTNFIEGLDNLTKTNEYSKDAIDQYWKKLQSTDNWYIVNPALIIQKPSFSYIETTTGETWSDRDLSVYPNPTNGQLLISGGAVAGKDFDALIFDNKGALVLSVRNERTLDLTGLESGVYTLSVRGEKLLLNKRIILVK